VLHPRWVAGGPSVCGPLALERIQAIGISQCVVDIFGEGNGIRVCWAQPTYDDVTWPGTEAPEHPSAGVHECGWKDIGSVQPDIDLHVFDPALDPTGSERLGGVLESRFDAKDGGAVATP
jgi:hypothetical protein